MVDIIALGIAVLVVVAVMLRKTSAGVGILALLAGVMLDQLLSTWILGLLPESALSASEYMPVIIHLLLTFTPVIVTLVAVKVVKHNPVLSILAGLILGFLMTYFGLKIVAPLPQVAEAAKNSGLLTFLNPYQSAILAGGATLALVEMILSHGTKSSNDKKKK